MKVNNIDRTLTREHGSRFNKSVYEQFKSFGILLKVRDNKLPYGSWIKKMKSDGYNPDHNYALIIKKSQDNPKHLVVLDVDVKKGAVGEESLKKLSEQLDINLLNYKTCITPSKGFHIYIISDVTPTFANKAKIKGLTDDIDIFTENNRNDKNSNYFLLPTNKRIKSKDRDGNEIIGEYKYNKDKIITGETANILITKLNSLFKDNTHHDNTTNHDYNDNKLDELLDADEIVANREKITIMLPYLKSYAGDYNTWVNIGGYIKKAGGNLKLFHEFSKLSNKYDKNAVNQKYEILPIDEGKGIGSLVFLARKAFIEELEDKINNIFDEDELKSLFKTNYFKNFINSSFLLNNEVEEKIISIVKDAYYNITFEEPTEEEINNIIFNIAEDSILNEYIPNTKDKYTIYSIEHVYIKDGKRSYSRVKNPIDKIQSVKNIKQIINSLRPIDDDRFLFIQNDEVVRIYSSRDIKNKSDFKETLKECFPKMNLFYYKNDEYKELINIEGIRKHLVGKKNYTFLQTTDLIKDKLTIDEDKKMIINYKLFELDNNIDDFISDEDKNSVINVFNDHWENKLYDITKWIIMSGFITNIKHKNLAILAKSNTGKSFYFKDILNKIGLTSNIKIEDYIKNGTTVNNFTLDEVINKYGNVFDETQYFKRELFDISNELTIRPLYSQNIKVKVGSKIFLSADGGHFRNDYLDAQIINRVTILDFKDVDELNNNKKWKEIIKEIGETNAYHILLEHYHKVYRDYIIKLNNMTNRERDEEEKRLNNILNNFTQRSKKIDSNKRVIEVIDEFLSSPTSLDDKVKNEVFSKIYLNKKDKKMVILNAKKVLSFIFDSYDSELARDKKYMQLDRIIDIVPRFLNKRGYLKINEISKRGLIVNLENIDLFNLINEMKLEHVD
jgi:hypothetical protein